MENDSCLSTRGWAFSQWSSCLDIARLHQETKGREGCSKSTNIASIQIRQLLTNCNGCSIVVGSFTIQLCKSVETPMNYRLGVIRTTMMRNGGNKQLKSLRFLTMINKISYLP